MKALSSYLASVLVGDAVGSEVEEAQRPQVPRLQLRSRHRQLARSIIKGFSIT